MLRLSLIVLIPLAAIAAAYYWRDRVDSWFPAFKGWRTVILNGASAGVILLAEVANYLAGFSWGSILSATEAAYLTLYINVANIALRFATSSPVGER